MSENRRLGQDLMQALERSELQLNYQPKTDIASTRACGVEACLHWRHPELGLLGAAQFMPAAMDQKLLRAIGEWMLAAACAQARRWHDAQPGMKLPIAVSLPLPLHGELPMMLRRAIAQYGIVPSSLQLNVTESQTIHDIDQTSTVLREISGDGIMLVMDNFGTGFASLSILKSLPIDSLKIDRTLISKIGHSRDDAAIVTAIVGAAHALGLQVVADGVETLSQLAALKSLGCDQYLGQLSGAAMPEDILERHLRKPDGRRAGLRRT